MTIGDTVRVNNPGARFSEYIGWVELNAPAYKELFDRQFYFNTNSAAHAVGNVIAIAPHGGDIREAERYGTLVLIATKINGTECAMLFRETALTVIKPAVTISYEDLLTILTA